MLIGDTETITAWKLKGLSGKCIGPLVEFRGSCLKQDNLLSMK